MKKVSEMTREEWDSYQVDCYQMSHYERFSSERELQVYSKRRGGDYHWFDADTKRFFSSRVGMVLHGQSPANWNIFITSERNRWSSKPRLYSVRQLMIWGRVVTLSEFQQFTSSAAAQRWARKYIAAAETQVIFA